MALLRPGISGNQLTPLTCQDTKLGKVKFQLQKKQGSRHQRGMNLVHASRFPRFRILISAKRSGKLAYAL